MVLLSAQRTTTRNTNILYNKSWCTAYLLFPDLQKFGASQHNEHHLTLHRYAAIPWAVWRYPYHSLVRPQRVSLSVVVRLPTRRTFLRAYSTIFRSRIVSKTRIVESWFSPDPEKSCRSLYTTSHCLCRSNFSHRSCGLALHLFGTSARVSAVSVHIPSGGTLPRCSASSFSVPFRHLLPTPPPTFFQSQASPSPCASAPLIEDYLAPRNLLLFYHRL